MTIKKIFLLLFFLAGLLSLSNTYVSAAPLCTSGDYEHPYSYTKYTCDEFKGCDPTTYNRVGNCDQWAYKYNTLTMCGFCAFNSQFCSDTRVWDSETRSYYYVCNISWKTNEFDPLCNHGQPNMYLKNCGVANSCPAKTIDCNSGNKCGKWNVNTCPTTSFPAKDCGGCGNNQYCKSNSASGTNSGGNCTAGCVAKTCAQLGADGTKGAPCGKQNNSCGTTITCGGCNSGLTCTGANASGVGGTCTVPTGGTVTALVFYDTGSDAKQTTYNNCYPATNSSGAGPTSANVSLTINSGDSGVPTQTYTNKSYKNCRRDGKTSSALGFVIQRDDTSKVIKLNPLSGYISTGYNYSINGGATVTCAGNTTKTGCSGKPSQTPALDGTNIVVRFGVIPGTPPTQVSGLVFIDDNGNGQYEPGTLGNTEVCYDGVLNGNATIGVGGSNNSFPQKKTCNLFSYTNTVAAQQVKLTQIPTGFQATGFEYQDSIPRPGTTNNCFSPDIDPGTGWCVHLSATNDTSEIINLAGNADIHFGIKPAPNTFTVKGSVYVDTSNYGIKEINEHIYYNDCPPNNPCDVKYRKMAAYAVDDAGNIAATPTDTDPDNNAGGSDGYTLNLPAGKYYIEYIDPATSTKGPPPGYTATYPGVVNPFPPQYLVNVGSTSCWIQKVGQTSLNDASCSSGNINGLNFGVNNSAVPWFQSVGGDVRVDRDLSDAVPSTATNPYVSISKASPAYDSGIVFTAKSSANFGLSGDQSSRANSKNLLSLSNAYNPTSAGTRSNYEYLNAVITRGGITPAGLGSAGYCGNGGISNCKLVGSAATGPTSTFPSGVYKTTGDLKITNSGYTFPTKSNYIILVPGNLTISSNLNVPTDSTVVFAVTGYIQVSAGVTNIDGIYSANGKFNAVSDNSALTVNGTVIANANLSSTTDSIDDVLNNDRDLGAGNATSPSLVFNFRPDFVLHLPQTIKVPNYVIQEVAPGPAYNFGTSQVTPTVTPTPSVTPTPTPIPTPTPTPALAWKESGGVVAIEAEHADLRVTSNGNSWSDFADTNAVGGTAIRALPNNDLTYTPPNSAEVRFSVYFATTGTYYVWVRGYSANISSNTVAAGKDGAPNATYISYPATSSWNWTDSDLNGHYVTVSIPSAGLYTVSLWERDDGARIDRIVLKQVNNAPSGTGPAESAHATYP